MAQKSIVDYIIRHGSNAALDGIVAALGDCEAYQALSADSGVRSEFIRAFAKLRVWRYYIRCDEQKRPAYAVELANPSEYLFGESELSCEPSLHESLSALLWLSTGLYTYAEECGLEYASEAKKQERVAVTARMNAERLTQILRSCKSVKELRSELLDAEITAKQLSLKPQQGVPADYKLPFIPWRKAAAGCIAMGRNAVSGAKYRLKGLSAQKSENVLLPHEKAEFIRVFKRYVESPPKEYELPDGVLAACEGVESEFRADMEVASKLAYRIMCAVRQSGYMRCSPKQLLVMQQFLDARRRAEAAKSVVSNAVPIIHKLYY